MAIVGGIDHKCVRERGGGVGGGRSNEKGTTRLNRGPKRWEMDNNDQKV